MTDHDMQSLLTQLQATSGLTFTAAGTGGGCVALQAFTPTGDEVLCTGSDDPAALPDTPAGPWYVAAYDPDDGGILLEAGESSGQADAQALDLAGLLATVWEFVNVLGGPGRPQSH